MSEEFVTSDDVSAYAHRLTTSVAPSMLTDETGEAVRTATAPAAIGLGPLLGDSAPMRALFAHIERIAPTAANVLVTGESGTGKELVA